LMQRRLGKGERLSCENGYAGDVSGLAILCP